MTRRMAVSIALFLLLATAYSCKKEEIATDTTATETASAGNTIQSFRTECTPSGDDVCVTLQITGIAHLIGEPASTSRLVVVPNATGVHHTPLLLTRKAHFTTKEISLLDKEKPDAAGTPYYYKYFPAGFEIDLLESGWENPTTPILDLVEDGDPAIPCPDEGNTKISAESLYWLPRLSLASKYTGAKPTLKPTFTGKNPLATDVVTRLEITDGKLSTRFAGDHVAKWRFERNGTAGDDHVQAVGSYLIYTFKAKLKTVSSMQLFVLRGRKFTDSTITDIATFRPNAGGRVFITLANVVHDSFFDPKVKDEIEHFDEYYKIYDTNHPNPTATKPMRLKNGDVYDNCALNPGDSGVECGPAQPLP